MLISVSSLLHLSQTVLFTMSLDSHLACNSQCHLSSDYEWKMLPSIDNNALFNTSQESPPTAFAGKVQGEKKSMPTGAVPKSCTMKDTPSTAGAAAFPQPSTGQAIIETPPLFWPKAQHESNHFTGRSSASKRNSSSR